MKKLRLIYFTILMMFSCQKEKFNSSDLIESNAKGLRIIENAVNIHGLMDDDSTVAFFKVMNENFVHQGQSVKPLPPFEKYSWNWVFLIDRINEEEIITSSQRGGGYVFDEMWVTDRMDSLYYNLNTNTYSKHKSDIIEHFNLFPQTYLQAALKSRLSVRYVYDVVLDGEPTFVIDALNGQTLMRLWISKEKLLLLKVEFLAMSYPYGDGIRSYLFNNYFRIGKLMLPSNVLYDIRTDVFDSTTNRYLISETKRDIFKKPEKKENLRADYSYRKKRMIVNIAPLIYMIENISYSTEDWSYNVIFAEFNDFILVSEAPLNSMICDEIIDLIKKAIPDKPIRFLVQTHHHNDHMGGIRSYIAEGATIVTGDKNTDLIKKISKAPFVLKPDRLANSVLKPKFEYLQSKNLKIEDDSNEVIVYDIGPTDHAEQMLIMYFPKQKILFQSDMLNNGEWPLNHELGMFLTKKLKELEISPKIIVGAHGRIINKQ